MVTGADIKSGYGQKKEKPYNSILPYLRSKADNKVVKAGSQKKSKPVQDKADKQDPENNDTEALKTMLKHIHPSATEDELESMIKNM